MHVNSVCRLCWDNPLIYHGIRFNLTAQQTGLGIGNHLALRSSEPLTAISQPATIPLYSCWGSDSLA
ncbi:hypothetical protein J6590_055553 [Homalodisca vitripennis]|nr:hypothetical protein J6590_055553 [Homalodisca vitripennis]